jgi:ribosomal protein S18 acetylase RimI-like enzyme
MTVVYRDMQDADAAAVAAMVQGLADHVGVPITTGLTGPKLVAARDLIDVTVAEDDKGLLGACLALMTFSTWRGTRGLYIVDLFVDERVRGRNVGRELMKQAARRGLAKGARFIKLEVDTGNQGAARFYERIGFARKDQDRLFILEQDGLAKFLEGE